MKSVRLNSYLRQCILDSVLTEFEVNYFKQRADLSASNLENLRETRKAVKARAVEALWDKAYGKYKADVLACPEWARSKETKLLVSLENDSSKMFQGYTKGLPCAENRVDLIISKEEWEKHLGEYYASVRAAEDYLEERKALNTEVKPILDSFGSTKQLLDTWPSLEKFLPPNIADPDKGVTLPALSLSRLEEKINGTN